MKRSARSSSERIRIGGLPGNVSAKQILRWSRDSKLGIGCADRQIGESAVARAGIRQPERRIAGYVATERQKHDDYRKPCPRGPLPEDATRVDRMKRKLQTKAGKAVYAARKTIVDPVFGQIKQARGFRQFLMRGIDKVSGEWALVCLTHNVLKLYRLCNE